MEARLVAGTGARPLLPGASKNLRPEISRRGRFAASDGGARQRRSRLDPAIGSDSRGRKKLHDFNELVVTQKRPMAGSVRKPDHVSLPAINFIYHRKAAAAVAGRADCGIVTDIVANERGGEIMQIRYHHPAGFSGAARKSILVKDFEDHMLGLNMIVGMLGALQGQISGFLCGVHIDQRNIPFFLAECTQMLRYQLR